MITYYANYQSAGTVMTMIKLISCLGVKKHKKKKKKKSIILFISLFFCAVFTS